MIYEFDGFRPVIHESAYVHPNATVTGNVVIGRDVYVGPGAAIRGDWGAVLIEDGCNVQENCTVHMFPGVTVRLEEGAHIGHGAVVHGARVGRNSLVGIDRKSTRLNSSHANISYAVFCLKKKTPKDGRPRALTP